MQTNASAIADALFPLVRQRVLGVLLSRPDVALHLREIARQAGLAPATVQREVMTLAHAGVLVRQQVGRQVVYAPSPDCNVIPELRRLVFKTVGLAGVVAEALRPLGERVQHAALFGSTAAGTALPDSDVDLLVVGEASLTELADRLREARAVIGREVNIVSMSREALEAALQGGDAFLRNVLSGPHVALKGDWDELAGLAGATAAAALPRVGTGDG
jgi:predicted nucleotidyltransferase